MQKKTVYHLWERFGIELEYTIVSRETGRVLPIADQLLRTPGGKINNSRKLGPCIISNELALHVIELKTPEPVAALNGWEDYFLETLHQLDKQLKPLGAMLMPTGMHPLMNPSQEAVLWPHSDQEVYRTYDNVFNCSRHGWCNLNSCHLNCSFHGDEEFKKLHLATILLLPVLPSLSASSPFFQGRSIHYQDTRLYFYQHNQARSPLVGGGMIPEPITSKKDYYAKILHPMYRQMHALDPSGLLEEPWLNSRAAIPHFDRGSLEIRALDAQECPLADLAICDFIICLLRWIIVQRSFADLVGLVNMSTTPQRRQQWQAVIQHGMHAPLQLIELFDVFRVEKSDVKTLADFWENIWRHAELRPEYPPFQKVIKHIIFNGNLASRMQLAISDTIRHQALSALIPALNECLMHNQLYCPHPD